MEQLVRTGDIEQDRMEVDRWRAYAASHGHGLETYPLPTGGVHVRVVESPRWSTLETASYRRGGHPSIDHSRRGCCMLCGRWAPVTGVLFRQNIGALVMRFTSKVEGPLCRPCIGSTFFRTTLVTLFLGPWGFISHFVTLYILPTNLLMYWRARSLPDGDGLGPKQLGPRRKRYTVVAALGLVGTLFALVWIAAGVAMIVSPPEDGSRLGAVAFTWLSILIVGAPFGALTALGLRGRARAARPA